LDVRIKLIIYFLYYINIELYNIIMEHTFSNIPNELLFTIFDDLDTHSILSLCKSNKINNNICSEDYDYLWKKRFNTILHYTKLIRYNGNALVNNYISHITYNTIEEYNTYNNSEFNNWYEVVNHIDERIQYFNNCLKKITEVTNHTEIILTDDEYNIYLLIIEEIKLNRLEIVKYLISHFNNSKNKHIIINNIFSYVLLYSNLNLYKYFLATYNSQKLITRMKLPLKNTNKEIINYIYQNSDNNKKLEIFEKCCLYKSHSLIMKILTNETFITANVYNKCLPMLFQHVDDESIEVGEFLVDKALQVGVKGENIMKYACECRNIEIIMYLNELGINLKYEHLQSVISPKVYKWMDGSRTSQPKPTINKQYLREILQLFINNGIMPNSSNMQSAIILKDLETIKILVSLGYVLTNEDLNYAMINNMEIVEFIISQGVIPNEDNINIFIDRSSGKTTIYDANLILKDVNHISYNNIRKIVEQEAIHVYRYIVDNKIKMVGNPSTSTLINKKFLANILVIYNRSRIECIDYAIDNNIMCIEDIFDHLFSKEDTYIMEHLYNRLSEKKEKVSGVMLLALKHKHYKRILRLATYDSFDFGSFIVSKLKYGVVDTELLNFIRSNFGDISIDDKNMLLINAYENNYNDIIRYLLDIGADISCIPNITDAKYNKVKNFGKDIRVAVMNNNASDVVELIREKVYPTNELVQLAKDLGYTRLANFMKYYIK
ncbi:Ankyrin-repeat protein with F-box domain, partial [Orpheovirus IHUMI-LCC2]